MLVPPVGLNRTYFFSCAKFTAKAEHDTHKRYFDKVCNVACTDTQIGHQHFYQSLTRELGFFLDHPSQEKMIEAIDLSLLNQTNPISTTRYHARPSLRDVLVTTHLT